ncbi:MAG TPA: DUF475 domain-containing protein [Methanocorpusculum sp.]|nr:DUF475 domain-containing protein [Methanocorpusculum sp.]
MESVYSVLVVIGLITFEIVTSIDNVVINVDILSSMKERARRWFLIWGSIIAIFGIRGVLPWFIIWFSVPSLGPIAALTVTLSNDTYTLTALHQSAPFLHLAGGIFMIFLFLHWFLVEKKYCSTPSNPSRIQQDSIIIFYAVTTIILSLICYATIKINALLTIATIGGTTIFFIVQWLQRFAGKKSNELENNTSTKSDISKLILLEVIDATFSIDSVIGAFAFTMSIPLILIGNGIGAMIVREFTIKSINIIKDYIYIKSAAMYSIGILGLIMCGEGFNLGIPIWFAPLLTIGIVAICIGISLQKIKKGN